MKWWWQQWDNNNVMAMGSQQRAKCLRPMCHASEATINLCQQFEEELKRERDNFGGVRWQKRVEIALSLLNRFQTYLPATPGRQEKDWNLFRMFPGSEAALSVPLWACLMMMKKWTVRWQLVSCLGGGIWATWLVLHFYKVLIKITKANHIRFSVTQNY